MDSNLKEQLVRAVFRFRRMNMELPPELEIRMGEFFLLKQISGDGPCHGPDSRLADVHHHLHMTRPAVSQMLNALEKKELIHREIDRNDRRKISVTLTEKGLSTLDQAMAYMDGTMIKTISRFGEDNTRQLIALLTLLADVLEKVSHESGEDPSANNKGENGLD